MRESSAGRHLVLGGSGDSQLLVTGLTTLVIIGVSYIRPFRETRSRVVRPVVISC